MIEIRLTPVIGQKYAFYAHFRSQNRILTNKSIHKPVVVLEKPQSETYFDTLDT